MSVFSRVMELASNSTVPTVEAPGKRANEKYTLEKPGASSPKLSSSGSLLPAHWAGGELSSAPSELQYSLTDGRADVSGLSDDEPSELTLGGIGHAQYVQWQNNEDIDRELERQRKLKKNESEELSPKTLDRQNKLEACNSDRSDLNDADDESDWPYPEESDGPYPEDNEVYKEMPAIQTKAFAAMKSPTYMPSPTESQLLNDNFEFHNQLSEEVQAQRFSDRALQNALQDVVPDLSRKEQWNAWRKAIHSGKQPEQAGWNQRRDPGRDGYKSVKPRDSHSLAIDTEGDTDDVIVHPADKLGPNPFAVHSREVEQLGTLKQHWYPPPQRYHQVPQQYMTQPRQTADELPSILERLSEAVNHERMAGNPNPPTADEQQQSMINLRNPFAGDYQTKYKAITGLDIVSIAERWKDPKTLPNDDSDTTLFQKIEDRALDFVAVFGRHWRRDEQSSGVYDNFHLRAMSPPEQIMYLVWPGPYAVAQVAMEEYQGYLEDNGTSHGNPNSDERLAILADCGSRSQIKWLRQREPEFWQNFERRMGLLDPSEYRGDVSELLNDAESPYIGPILYPRPIPDGLDGYHVLENWREWHGEDIELERKRRFQIDMITAGDTHRYISDKVLRMQHSYLQGLDSKAVMEYELEWRQNYLYFENHTQEIYNRWGEPKGQQVIKAMLESDERQLPPPMTTQPRSAHERNGGASHHQLGPVSFDGTTEVDNATMHSPKHFPTLPVTPTSSMSPFSQPNVRSRHEYDQLEHRHMAGRGQHRHQAHSPHSRNNERDMPRDSVEPSSPIPQHGTRHSSPPYENRSLTPSPRYSAQIEDLEMLDAPAPIPPPTTPPSGPPPRLPQPTPSPHRLMSPGHATPGSIRHRTPARSISQSPEKLKKGKRSKSTSRRKSAIHGSKVEKTRKTDSSRAVSTKITKEVEGGSKVKDIVKQIEKREIEVTQKDGSPPRRSGRVREKKKHML